MIKLTSSNYSIWKPQMEDIFYCKDLHDPILAKNAPEGKTDKEWEVLHRKAVAYIRRWIDPAIFHHVSQETNAHTLWAKLEAMYERKTAQNKATLIRRLVNLKYKDGRNVTEHLSDFQGLVNQLNTMKMVLDDELQALLLLSLLPDTWDTLVVTLSNSVPQGKITLDVVKDRMLNEESRRKDASVSFDSEALVFERKEQRGRSQFRYPQNGDRSRSKSRGRSRPRKEVTCFYCNKKGHFMSE